MALRERMLCALAMISLLGVVVAPAMAGAQDPDTKKEKKQKDGDKAGKGGDDSDANARGVLWQEPRDIENRDLFWGPGGREGAPDPNGKFTFVKRSTAGTSEKIRVVDDKGREWTVKFGPEARPETAASRIVWAAGYHVDANYFVKRAHIEGRGGFDVWDVRFERHDSGYKELKKNGLWAWKANPFMGTRELQGLKALMALLANWDLKTENNKIVRPDKKGAENVHIYYVGDLGGTLGKTGNPIRYIPPFWSAPAGSKGDPEAYAVQEFLDPPKNGQAVFHYHGKDPGALEGVSVENARWIGNLLSRLSDKQLSDAFRAGGFTDAEVATYVKAIRGRINRLKNLK